MPETTNSTELGPYNNPLYMHIPLIPVISHTRAQQETNDNHPQNRTVTAMHYVNLNSLGISRFLLSFTYVCISFACVGRMWGVYMCVVMHMCAGGRCPESSLISLLPYRLRQDLSVKSRPS